MTIELTCYCCGITREFTNPDHAFHEDWDLPPYILSHPYIACGMCKIIIGLPPDCDIVKNHFAVVHERWKVEGHPETKRG